MLSRHSFNALLKTLEEPPPHVKFLLATTDPQKLPVTVLSRCLQFNLLALSPLQIEQHLAYVLTQEQIPFVPAALTLLAKAAKGSLRDSLSLTDQAIAQSNANISEDTVRAMLGLLDQSWAQLLLQAVLSQDASALQNALADLVQQQSNFSQVLDDMLSLLHLTALSQFSQTAANFSELQPFVLQLAETLAPAQVQLYYQLLISGKKELPYAPDPLTGLQMALLRAMAFAPDTQQPAAAQPRANTAAAKMPPPVVVNTPGQHVELPRQPAVAVPSEQPASDIAANTVTGIPVTDSTATDSSSALPLPESPKPAAPAADAAALPTQMTTEQVEATTGIDPVTARIMARRGVQVSSATTPKKTERQQAPTDVSSRPAEVAQPTLAHRHATQVVAAVANLSEAVQPSPVSSAEVESDVSRSYPIEEDGDVVQPQYDIAATEALWQQYSEDAPEQVFAAQSPAVELPPFDGSITEQNFSVRFAAQVDAWAARVETLDTGGLSRLFLLNAAIALDGNKLNLTVAQSQQHLDSGNFRTKLQQVLEQSFNQPLQIDISYQAEVAQSPLSIQQHIVQQRFDYVRTLLQQDENVLQLQQLFNAQLQKMQAEIATMEVTGEAGAGLVKITMLGNHNVRRVSIDDSLMQDDKDMLEDLIAAAINDAVRRVDETSKEKMAAVTGGLQLPPGMKMPF